MIDFDLRQSMLNCSELRKDYSRIVEEQVVPFIKLVGHIGPCWLFNAGRFSRGAATSAPPSWYAGRLVGCKHQLGSWGGVRTGYIGNTLDREHR